MRTLRREAVRTPLIRSRWGFWSCGGSIPSGVQDGVQVQVFMGSDQSLQQQHRWWSPWEVQSQTEGGSLGRVCRTQKASQDLDLVWGLRSVGHCVRWLLFPECIFCQQGVFRNVPQEQGQLGIWPATLNWWVPWTVRLRQRNRGLWDSGLKAWVPASL